jgi:hypothetical protein
MVCTDSMGCPHVPMIPCDVHTCAQDPMGCPHDSMVCTRPYGVHVVPWDVPMVCMGPTKEVFLYACGAENIV